MLKNYFSAIIVLFIMNISFTQTTTLNDSRFEQALINLGYDDVPDYSVLTSNISGITYLDIRPASIYSKINDLTGIEDFTSLETLLCGGNNLSTLDVSKNTALKKLDCPENQLTTLIVSGATNLESIYCDLNQLTSLDVSQNFKLNYIKCFSNRLTSLDLSSNPLLTYVRCTTNNLSSLNVKNGNNSILTSFNASGNSSLACIQVDDETAANNAQAPYTNWVKDAAVIYSEDCNSLSIYDEKLSKSILIYPNPSSIILSISSETVPIKKVEVYTVLGEKVKDITNNYNSIKIEKLSKGIYIIKIYSDNGFAVKKFIKK